MGKLIYNFFWWLAGANRKILKEHVTDYDKYFQIGVAVFITAIMASLTGGFAFHYAVHKGFTGDISLFTILFSIFWGFIILNLDRFLVLSMKKQGNSLVHPTAYEKFQNFMGEFIFAIPRILLAILIASVILAPLELFLFKDQISNHISIINEKEKDKFMNIKRKELEQIENEYRKDKKIIENKYVNLIKSLESKQNRLENRIKTLQTPINIRLDKLKKDLEDARKIQKENWDSTERERANGGCGKNCQKLISLQTVYNNNVAELVRQIQEEKDKNENKNRENQGKILKLYKEIELIQNQINDIELNKTKELDNLLKKLQNDKQLITDAKNQYKNKYQGNNIMIALKAKDALFETDLEYKGIHVLFTLLLITIELLPLIVKILLSRSSYDAHIQRISDEESMKHDTFIREEKLKYQMEFKSLRLRENIKFQTLDRELKKVKFSSNE